MTESQHLASKNIIHDLTPCTQHSANKTALCCMLNRRVISGTRATYGYVKCLFIGLPVAKLKTEIDWTCRKSGRYFIYDYYYVPKHSYYILPYIIIITL